MPKKSKAESDLKKFNKAFPENESEILIKSTKLFDCFFIEKETNIK